MSNISEQNSRLRRLRSLLLCGVFAPVLTIAPSHAQSVDEVVVTGSRAVVQDSIELKRDAEGIVDGLSTDEIGEIPALSIGEALETLTGASSHRENGGATEVSIRGLGPFLGSTVINGRTATNGSGDRSVNFSQFPSELMNKLVISKTQDASMIEGGVSGQIMLETVKPLDFGKSRFQVDLKGNYNPDQAHIADTMEGDLGHRITGSYVDQFDIAEGSLGVAIGIQTSAISQPEQEIRSTSPTGSSLWACLINGTGDNADQGFTETASRDDDCEDDNANGGNDAYDNSLDPNTGLAVDDGQAYTFAGSQRGYRQNDTSDKRDAVFVALQFQPNDSWDINLDYQQSERTQAEDRYDLTFDNSRRNDRSIDFGGFTSTVDSLITDNGATQRIAYESEIASGGELYERFEEYTGFGLDVEYRLDEDTLVSLDVSSSETTRTEKALILRAQSGQKINTIYSIASGIPQYTIEEFDPTVITNFDNDVRLRIDNDFERENTADAFRIDVDRNINRGIITNVELGVRSAELSYVNIAGGSTSNGGRVELDDSLDSATKALLGATSDNDVESDVEGILRENAALISSGAYTDCYRPFAENGFLDSVRSGNLMSNVDEDGNAIAGYNGWATFDNRCLANKIIGAVNDANPTDTVISLAYPELTREASGNTNVTEETTAYYAKANFETELAGYPVRGNFGARYVETEVKSVGYRPTYTVATDPDDSTLSLNTDSSQLERVVGGASYEELLPSFGFTADLDENLLLRGGVFRAMSRVDPSDMSYKRTFSANTSDDDNPITELGDLLNVSGSGNPGYEPLMSWNYDLALEWYPTKDSILAAGVYYKRFNAGFENAVVNESFTIDGESVVLPITINSTSDEEADITGIELTAAHRFENGLGAKISYNYADSNFEFQDSNYGERGVRQADGTFTQTHVALVAPGNIPGLSKNVLSAKLYYQWDDFDIAAYYKLRDQYFQPYTSNGTRLRYVDKNEVLELRASVDVSENLKLSLAAMNLLDEPRVDRFYQENNFGQQSVYGPRLFISARYKM